MNDCLPRYFGCHNREGGHYAFGPGLSKSGHRDKKDPVGDFLNSTDSRHSPRGGSSQYDHGECAQGVASVSLVELPDVGVFTVLSFWDRSVDSRGGSSSTFALEGRLSFAEAVQAATAAFPEVWPRYKFTVTPRFGR